MHTLSRTRFKRRRLSAAGAGIQFQADLAEMPTFNDFSHFLLMVDLWSNFVYVEPLKSKSSAEVKKAFEKIFSENNLEKFTGIGTDKGTEFTANRKFFEEKGGHLYVQYGKNKAFQAETFIRIFKAVLYRYIRFKRSQDWPGALPKVAAQLNNRRQKNLGRFTPADLNSPQADPGSREYMKKKFQGKRLSLRKERKDKLPPSETMRGKGEDKRDFKVNDFVYITADKKTFDKGFDMQRGAIYKITGVDTTVRPYLYQLKEEDGTPLERKYYGENLKYAPNPDDIDHGVERIVDEKMENGVKKYKVRWSFYPEKYVPAVYARKLLMYLLCSNKTHPSFLGTIVGLPQTGYYYRNQYEGVFGGSICHFCH